MSKDLKPFWFPEMCKNGQFFSLLFSNLLLVKKSPLKITNFKIILNCFFQTTTCVCTPEWAQMIKNSIVISNMTLLAFFPTLTMKRIKPTTSSRRFIQCLLLKPDFLSSNQISVWDQLCSLRQNGKTAPDESPQHADEFDPSVHLSCRRSLSRDATFPSPLPWDPTPPPL